MYTLFKLHAVFSLNKIEEGGNFCIIYLLRNLYIPADIVIVSSGDIHNY